MGMTRILSFLAATAMAAPAHAVAHPFHAERVLGTSFDMTVVTPDAASANRAMLAARTEIERLDLVLSGWRDDSELAALNRSTGAFAASPELFQVISACEAWRADCNGAFSARLGTVEALWRQAERSGAAPDPDTLVRAATAAEAATVRLDPAMRTIDRDGVAFTVDAYAKGYIVDAALAAARKAAPSARGIMVDIGGDIACSGAPLDAAGWRFGIAHGEDSDNVAPTSLLTLRGGAVATSGTGARDRVIGGQSYSHLLLPENGQASPARLVSVVSRTAADADAMATALAAMPTARAIGFINARPGAEARIVDAQGAVFTSAGWPAAAPVKLQSVAYQTAPKAAAPRSAAWPAGYEVKIDYEIPVIGGARTKVPYVAIFVTNEAGQLVRTLTHLGDHPPRFLDSNYVWYGVFTGKGGQLSAVTRPSRVPGKYAITWDGKDDAGNLVGQGKYTIKIEVSREHGGHSLQEISLTLGAVAATGSAAALPESGPATASYGKSQ